MGVGCWIEYGGKCVWCVTFSYSTQSHNAQSPLARVMGKGRFLFQFEKIYPIGICFLFVPQLAPKTKWTGCQEVVEYRSPHIIKKVRICRESPFTGCSLRLYTACGNNTPPSPLVLLSRQHYASLVKVWYAQCRQKKHQNQTNNRQILVLSASDPCGNRTHVNGVRGRCLNRLTNGPY